MSRDIDFCNKSCPSLLELISEKHSEISVLSQSSISMRIPER